MTFFDALKKLFGLHKQREEELREMGLEPVQEGIPLSPQAELCLENCPLCEFGHCGLEKKDHGDKHMHPTNDLRNPHQWSVRKD